MADEQLSTCGAPKPPAGPCIEVPHTARLSLVVANGDTQPNIEHVFEEDFLWRGTIAPEDVRLLTRLRSPGNVFHSNVRIPLLHQGGGGNNARALDSEIFIPQGQAIVVDALNDTGADLDTYIEFVGVHRRAVAE